jgi:hypothetical protein
VKVAADFNIAFLDHGVSGAVIEWAVYLFISVLASGLYVRITAGHRRGHSCSVGITRCIFMAAFSPIMTFVFPLPSWHIFQHIISYWLAKPYRCLVSYLSPVVAVAISAP